MYYGNSKKYICYPGKAGRDSTFKRFEGLNDDDYRYGFERKFLGQIRFVSLGNKFIRDNGSYTFYQWLPKRLPESNQHCDWSIECSRDTYVNNIAPLLPRGIRINVVSPAPIVEPGREGQGLVTAAETAKLYVEAVGR